MSNETNNLITENGQSESNEIIILIVTDETGASDSHENIKQNTGHGYNEDTLLNQEEFKGLLHCTYCSKPFSSEIVLGNGRKCHKDDNLVCELCLKFFSQKGDREHTIKPHENRDRGELKPKASLKADCGSSNIQEGAVSRTLEKYECPCPRIFKRQYYYEKHMLAVHGKTYKHGSRDAGRIPEISQVDYEYDSSNKCTVCLQIFKNKNSLKVHFRSHSNNIYKCPDCSKIITTKGWFEQHIKSHGTARPFQCSVCKKSFTDEKRLKRHEYIHGTSIFKCPICLAQFTQKYLLLDHNKMHLIGSNISDDYHLNVLHSKVKF